MHINLLYDKHPFDGGKHWVTEATNDKGELVDYTRHFTEEAAESKKKQLLKLAERKQASR
jgi:hypothetical protein